MKIALIIIGSFLLLIVCFFLSILFQWCCEFINGTRQPFKKLLKDTFYDPKTDDYDWTTGIPPFLFSPLFAVLTFIIALCLFICWPLKLLYKKVVK